MIRLSLSADKIVGKPMPFSLQDALGRVVIARGEPVDAHIIGRIAAGELEICEDWSAPDPDAKGAERRVCERRACQTDIRLWLIGPGGVQPVEGEMVDLSRGGAGVRRGGDPGHAGRHRRGQPRGTL